VDIVGGTCSGADFAEAVSFDTISGTSDVDKAGPEICTGLLTGVFPSMFCEPVANEGYSWDSFKGYYR
jgi:hypothetical protein